VATDVAAFDPLPLLLLPVPFAIAACLASYVPAARAARVDPTVALRDL
jgi:ABC-type lipoprotein release transport system permease subunit